MNSTRTTIVGQAAVNAMSRSFCRTMRMPKAARNSPGAKVELREKARARGLAQNYK